jgi:uncharacterized protein
MAYQFILFFLIALSVFFAVHYFAYKTIIFAFSPEKPKTIRLLRLYFIFTPLFFIGTEILSFRLNDWLTRCLYISSAVLMGMFYFIFCASILFWVSYALAKIFNLTRYKQKLAFALLGLALIATVYALVSPWLIHAHDINITLPDLPDEWRGKKAAWISDLHLGQIWSRGTAEKVAKLLEAQHPDILFIGGDLYDGTPVDFDSVTNPFSRLDPPFGKYFITGNHEEFGNRQVFFSAVEKAGFQILNNSKVDIKGVQIIGIDYLDSRTKAQIDTVLKSIGVDTKRPAILLKHMPNELETAEKNGIDLQISGHTHGGQLFPINLITSLVFKGYDHGLQSFGSMQTYTSSGVGTWGPPLRFFAPPEIAIIHFL